MWYILSAFVFMCVCACMRIKLCYLAKKAYNKQLLITTDKLHLKATDRLHSGWSDKSACSRRSYRHNHRRRRTADDVVRRRSLTNTCSCLKDTLWRGSSVHRWSCRHGSHQAGYTPNNANITRLKAAVTKNNRNLRDISFWEAGARFSKLLKIFVRSS